MVQPTIVPISEMRTVTTKPNDKSQYLTDEGEGGAEEYEEGEE
jgi:hypothetical protein